MLKVRNGKQFKKDLKKYVHQQEAMKELAKVTFLLAQEKPLEEKHRDHFLIGNGVGYRECHVKNDLVLIYKMIKEERQLYLVRFGSHSEVLKI